MSVSEYQQVDIPRIRRYFEGLKEHRPMDHEQESRDIADMSLELCDLVEASTLLEDVARARKEAVWMDEPIVRPRDKIWSCITDLDPEISDPDPDGR